MFQEQDGRRRPALRDLDKIEMFSEGLTAPLHQGALKYFGEAKLR